MITQPRLLALIIIPLLRLKCFIKKDIDQEKIDYKKSCFAKK